jgi:2',3'-cyclic-nucleotide 2'-phosphodiesterase (5'-nucleotidase family)
MIKKISAFLVVLSLLVCVPLPSPAQQLTILHTNDTHSHLYPFGPLNKYGGIARMSYLIKKLKRQHQWQNHNVLTLNSGDVFVGTFAFNKYLGYAELKIMEGLYDTMCLGNHEFDLGVDALAGIISGTIPGDAPVTLPVLCANIKNLDSTHPLHMMVKPYRIQQVGPLKVGLIGVVTTDPYNYSEEVNAILSDPYEAAGEAAYALRSEGCDVVICLSHLGQTGDVEDLSQVDGIDIIVGGHSHDAIFEPLSVNGKIIVQAGEFGKHLGELTVDVTPGGVDLIDYKLHPINRKVRRDPTLLQTLFALRKKIYQDPRFGPVYTKRVAWAKRNMEEHWEEGNPNRDTPLGNLVADAIRCAVEDAGFTLGEFPLVAIEAMGYIGHRIYKGKVVGNDVMRSVPYGYDPDSGLGFKIYLVLLAGQQILPGLEYSVSEVSYTEDLSLQTSGLTFEYDSSKPPMGGRVDPLSVRIHGDPISPNGLYQVAINEQLLTFLGSLGLQPLAQIDTGLFEYNAVRDYMRKLRVLDYVTEGRIIDTSLLEE